ncbi:MAG: hypothetical protein ABSF84_02755 [Acidimicrobiales bacterium]|jgi:hypothetical protein
MGNTGTQDQGGTTSTAQLPARLPGTVVADCCYGGNNPGNVALAGTARHCYTVGIAATEIRAVFANWYTNTTGDDTDNTVTLTFHASIEDAAGNIYRLTFGGSQTGTLDGGGIVVSDPVCMQVNPGDVIATRTYLTTTNTANGNRTVQLLAAGNYGGWVSTDQTAPGSGAVNSSTHNTWGPVAIIGLPSTNARARAVLLQGDSIGVGKGDGSIGANTGPIPNNPWFSSGGYLVRALAGQAGIMNICVSSDAEFYFEQDGGHFRRMALASSCNFAVDEYGVNDIQVLGQTALQLETNLLARATDNARYGIAKTFIVTLAPHTTSTDDWITTVNQTVTVNEPTRVAHNTWVRAGGPISPTTLLPVAAGTAGALLFGQGAHPIAGYFDAASAMETALNSGIWPAPVRTLADGTCGTTTAISAPDANFVNAAIPAGDLGRLIVIPGAGVAGATYQGYIAAVGSATAATLTLATSTAIAGTATFAIGAPTADGIHPSPDVAAAASAMVSPSVFV